MLRSESQHTITESQKPPPIKRASFTNSHPLCLLPLCSPDESVVNKVQFLNILGSVRPVTFILTVSWSLSVLLVMVWFIGGIVNDTDYFHRFTAYRLR